MYDGRLHSRLRALARLRLLPSGPWRAEVAPWISPSPPAMGGGIFGGSRASSSKQPKCSSVTAGPDHPSIDCHMGNARLPALSEIYIAHRRHAHRSMLPLLLALARPGFRGACLALAPSFVRFCRRWPCASVAPQLCARAFRGVSRPSCRELIAAPIPLTLGCVVGGPWRCDFPSLSSCARFGVGPLLTHGSLLAWRWCPWRRLRQWLLPFDCIGHCFFSQSG